MNVLKKRYKDLIETHTQKINSLEKIHIQYAIGRLLILSGILVLLYFWMKESEGYYFLASILGMFLFVFLMRLHKKINRQLTLNKTLKKINIEEIERLEGKGGIGDEGSSFLVSGHPYAVDLDIFGKNSLFQNIQRTGSYLGRKKLADKMLQKSDLKEIIETQNAVAELKDRLEWRQEIFALAILSNDSEGLTKDLNAWAISEVQIKIPKYFKGIAYVLGVVTVVSFVYFVATSASWAKYVSGYGMGIQLVYFYSQIKKMKAELLQAEKIAQLLQNYSKIFECIEKGSFESEKLRSLQKSLRTSTSTASAALFELSTIFDRVQSIHNAFGSFILNGFVLYHLHALFSLIHWKRSFGTHLLSWLEVVGDIEFINSLSQFAFHEPKNVFPEISENEEIIFEAAYHPLLGLSKSVGNSISFNSPHFIVLTGSNMSGKSTFLRTLGTNMVLACMGSVVCAQYARVKPMDIWVSMKLSDSLEEGASYFFAEVQRLELIMRALDKDRCFVLLDEILRGTNSDDKRNGTLAVIDKMIRKHAFGVIATHDLEVCQIQEKYPKALMNACFEVEIINNELYFDYTLKKGICRNQSATFLMKKKGIIDVQ